MDEQDLTRTERNLEPVGKGQDPTEQELTKPELLAQHLDVYDTRNGPWNPEHGPVDIPDDWQLLPSGDAFVTRQVKAAGLYWVSWRPRGRNRPHRRKLGLWAPAEIIGQARATAEDTAARRARGRERGAAQRARAEDRYREELEAAIIDFLAFAPAHHALATEIAEAASHRAAVVGSGRVGRTRKLTLEDRAALAARAWIRHRFTDYEDHLGGSVGDEFIVRELEYRDLKRAANEAVDEFLESHRS